MRELRVGDIYYWNDPEGLPWSHARLCLVVDADLDDKQLDGQYTFGTVLGQDSDYDYIVKKCMRKEIREGRLHYIGRL